FFNDTATTEIYTLSLHDALPISVNRNGSGTSGTAVRNSPSSASPQGGWQRFGAPGGSGSAPSQGQSPPGSPQNYGSSPNNQGQRYNAPSGGSSLRIAPPVVRAGTV